jgi:hypothetical protein
MVSSRLFSYEFYNNVVLHMSINVLGKLAYSIFRIKGVKSEEQNPNVHRRESLKYKMFRFPVHPSTCLVL